MKTAIVRSEGLAGLLYAMHGLFGVTENGIDVKPLGRGEYRLSSLTPYQLGQLMATKDPEIKFIREEKVQ